MRIDSRLNLFLYIKRFACVHKENTFYSDAVLQGEAADGEDVVGYQKRIAYII